GTGDADLLRTPDRLHTCADCRRLRHRSGAGRRGQPVSPEMNDAARRKPGKVLCAVKDMQLARWIELLSHRRDVVTPEDDLSDPDIRFAVVWRPDPGLLAGLKGLEVIFSMGAGVDRLLEDPTIPDLPIVRVVDPSLTSHMVEFVLWRVLDHHRQGRLYREQQAARHWRQHKQWLAREVTVGVMGFG